MTAYGFDLDGTLTRPELAMMANDLWRAGHEIYVITGGLADTGEWTMEARIAYLKQLGVHYTAIVRCIDPDIHEIGALKGKECTRLNIAVMIDDAQLYLAGARPWSSAVQLLVLE